MHYLPTHVSSFGKGANFGSGVLVVYFRGEFIRGPVEN